jgi:hypothetical protein
MARFRESGQEFRDMTLFSGKGIVSREFLITSPIFLVR